jgi:outer membrane protein OmpA-like peptidoglycan-associated protein
LNYFPHVLANRYAVVLSKLLTAMVILTSSLVLVKPLSASATPTVSIDHEVAGSLNAGNSAAVDSTSCTSLTSCVAGGVYTDASTHTQTFVSVYNGSSWTDREVAGVLNSGNHADISSASCATSGLCVVGGNYTDANDASHAFVSSTTVPSAYAKVSGSIYFASGSSTLSATARRTLDTLATQILSHRQSSVTLDGYTDSWGSTAMNVRLSASRAASVKSYLQARLRSLGDLSVTFVVHGRGVTRSGSSDAMDRRVTLS